MADAHMGVDLEAFVAREIAAGRYQDRDEAVQAGLLRLYEDAETEDEHLVELRRLIQESLDDPEPSVSIEVVRDDLRQRHARTSTARIAS